ncbi:MAG: type III pantothenate kinase [Chloroflexota bacterium]
MLLAVDVGNANLKLGLFAGDVLVSSWRLATDARRTADEYGLLLAGLLGDALREPIEAVAIASVVPQLDPLLAEMSERYVGAKPLFLGTDMPPALPVLTEQPQHVGADRLADALAGARLYGCPLITLDLGTATVLNAISREGALIGGAIVPGIGTIAETISRRTAKLPPVPLVAPERAIGRNTVTALQSGLVYGYVGLVEGLIDRFWAELGQCPVVATGGFGGLVAAQTTKVARVDASLTLQGLRLAYEHFVEGRKGSAASAR